MRIAIYVLIACLLMWGINETKEIDRFYTLALQMGQEMPFIDIYEKKSFEYISSGNKADLKSLINVKESRLESSDSNVKSFPKNRLAVADVTIPFSSRSDLDWFSISKDQNVNFVNGPKSDAVVMQANIPKGKHYGIELDYTLEGVDEIHMKWEQYIPSNWTTAEGTHMKFPGIGNRERHGWGGRRTDGTGGWSVRTGIRDGSACNDSVTVEFYVYHMDMGDWGSVYTWQTGENDAVILREEWTEIENYVKVNTPGNSDGVIKGWVNGNLAFQKEDLRFRAKGYDQYDIQEIMWHIYHGGSSASPINQHVYFRNLEIWFGDSITSKE